MQNRLAPVVIFVYARRDHVEKTISALLSNELSPDTDLIVYSDGARSHDDVEKVAEVRIFFESLIGFKSVTLRAREHNFGLAKNIIEGVTEVLEDHESLIVLEDDMVTSPFFLKYMNDALDFYKDDSRIISVHGYIFPVKLLLPETFFLLGADCWGWATWRRGWEFFNCDGNYLLEKIKQRGLQKKFDFNGAYPYTQMLLDQIEGRNNSWAIRWYASAFLADKLTLYPGKSLVLNIGNDGSGTHCEQENSFDVSLSSQPIVVGSVKVEDSYEGRRAFEEFLNSLRGSFLKRLKRFLFRFLR